MSTVDDRDKSAVPRLQPGSKAGGSVRPTAPLSSEWQEVLNQVEAALGSAKEKNASRPEVD